MNTYTIDLNCDLGESFGAYQMGRDKDLIPLVSSVNIACGFHAGDPSVMKRTVRLALENAVAIGAHPGLPDLVGFGRRPMGVSPEEVYDMVVYQIGALNAFVKTEGGNLRHVKPHGALYNMAATDQLIAEAIAEGVFKVDPELVLVGLAGSKLIEAGKKAGLKSAREAFADRAYQQDGTLRPRHYSDAVISDVKVAASQVIRMLKEGAIRSIDGGAFSVEVDTVCVHGDGPYAVEFAKKIRQILLAEGVKIQPFFL